MHDIIAKTLMVVGELQSLTSAGIASGWCWSPGDPLTHRSVVLLADGKQLVTATCEESSDALASIGVGDGTHAFKAQIPAELLPLAHAAAEIYLEDLQTGSRVGRSVKFPSGSTRPNAAAGTSTASQEPASGRIEPTVLKERIRHGRLFDAAWYVAKYKVPSADYETLLEDFTSAGINLGREPNALFNSGFYRERYLSSIAEAPFEHYIRVGIDLDYAPNPLVEPSWVKKQLTKLALTDGVLSALLHKCAPLSIDPHPCFSVRFYLQRYPEILMRRAHPLIHYLNNGWAEKRCPHPLFWPEWFEQASDGAVANRNPLLAYLLDRRLHTIPPNPFFHVDHYWQSCGLSAPGTTNPLLHYLVEGGQFSPNPAIDAQWACRTYRVQLATLRTDPLSFLLQHENGFIYGSAERRQLTPVETAKPTAIYALRGKALGSIASKARRRRILYLSHNLKIQGAQTSLFELATGMARSPDNEVIVLAPDDGPMGTRYRHHGIDVIKYVLPVSGLADSRYYAKLFTAYCRQIIDLAPDLMHGNTVQAYHGIAAAAANNIATLWNIRESEDPAQHFSGLEAPAQELMLKAIETAGGFAFVSRTTQRVWLDAYPKLRSWSINNGLNYDNFTANPRDIGREPMRAMLGLRPSEILIYNVGTWTARKGQRDIVEAIRHIDRRLWPCIRVLMIGRNHSEYGRSIQASLEDLPVALRERFMIYEETTSVSGRSLVLGVYAAADIFAFTSRIESYPRVINEALYFGTPIVSTPCFGVAEQLQPGLTGLYYEPGDAAQLARHIERLVIDRKCRREMGLRAAAAAFDHVVQYDDMLAQYQNIYNTLLSDRAGAPAAAA
jgi:glycosyltransferase involved in cell wall biosynthesis